MVQGGREKFIFFNGNQLYKSAKGHVDLPIAFLPLANLKKALRLQQGRGGRLEWVVLFICRIKIFWGG